jgi:Fe-coproporphyrin III synthase
VDLSVIITHRCDSKIQMCYICQNPTDPKEEIGVDILAKLRAGLDNVNITDGEPNLRKDRLEICDILYPKVKTIEINSNGLHHDRILPIVKKYSDIKIRFSLEISEMIISINLGEKDDDIKKLAGLKIVKYD